MIEKYEVKFLPTDYYFMWYSAELSVYIGETDCNGKRLGRPIVLKMMDEIFKELKGKMGLAEKIMYFFSKKRKERQLRKNAYVKALEKVGLGNFRPHFMMDHEYNLDVRASSPEEAKKKLVEKREDILKYCNTAFSPEENLIIEESRLYN